MTTRPIVPLDFEEDVIASELPTAKPELTWVRPTDLCVDEVYQRELTARGRRLIQKIIENFDWRKYKLPTAVWGEAGLEIIDGQHTCIACASHPEITEIPIMVIEAAEMKDRAATFIGVNKDRLIVSNMQLHKASVVAQDDAAQAIERVCEACGVKVLTASMARSEYKPRETIAVKSIDAMIKRVGEPLAQHILGVLAEANFGPITGMELRAAEALLMDDQYTSHFEPAELTKAIVALGAEAYNEAAVFAANFRKPKWEGLVHVWFTKTKKKKGTAATPRVIDRRPTPGPLNLGEPEPGRSALDQRVTAEGKRA